MVSKKISSKKPKEKEISNKGINFSKIKVELLPRLKLKRCSSANS